MDEKMKPDPEEGREKVRGSLLAKARIDGEVGALLGHNAAECLSNT